MRKVTPYKMKELFGNVEVKNIKRFSGHDAHQISCTIYVDGKRTVTMLDDSWGGDYDYTVINEEKWNIFQEKVKQLPEIEFEGNPMKYNVNIVVADLIQLKEEEKVSKKYAKNNTLVRFENENYDIGAYIEYAIPYTDNIHEKIEKIAKENGTTAKIYNQNMSWK